LARYKNLIELSTTTINSYIDSQEEEQKIIEENATKLGVIDSMNKEFKSNLIRQYFDVFNNWTYKYPYSSLPPTISAGFRGTDFAGLPDPNENIIKIEKVILSFLKSDRSLCLERYVFENKKDDKHKSIPNNIGKLEFLDEYNFDEGEFGIKFTANRDFIGVVDVQVFSESKYTDKYKEENNKSVNYINDLHGKIEIEKQKIKLRQKEEEKEKKRIIDKLEFVKNNDKIVKKLDIIRKPLYDLGYDTEKFIDFLLKEKNIKSNNETILQIFKCFESEPSGSNNFKRNQQELENFGIHFRQDEENGDSMIKKLNYLTEEQVKVLAEILKEIGFSISSFQLLVSYLKEIKTVDIKNQANKNEIEQSSFGDERLIKKREKLIQDRKSYFDTFKKYRNKISSNSSLKLFDNLSKSLDFTGKVFNELADHKKFVNKDNKIFENTFIMKKLSSQLENYEINTTENTSENFEGVETYDDVNALNNILFDFELEHLNEFEKIKKRLITITKLEAITDVKLIFIKIEIYFLNLFFSPRCLNFICHS
jgi:hypothetical protein